MSQDVKIAIPNLVLTSEQYRKLKIYAAKKTVSINQIIQQLIDSLPEKPR
ncbi:MAG: hypothetical protein KME59_10015 [Trichormus sp. ATA11-4-KO1]|jgi:hypothetical protein|nr:hypothetical protein [Trichormus sp. ATA11-4-KO1]